MGYKAIAQVTWWKAIQIAVIQSSSGPVSAIHLLFHVFPQVSMEYKTGRSYQNKDITGTAEWLKTVITVLKLWLCALTLYSFLTLSVESEAPHISVLH